MRIEFSVANPGDDAEIRALLAANPMPGRIEVTFEREPDYFLGSGVSGSRGVTMKGVDAATGRIAGLIQISASDRFVNGRVTGVGYIGGARVDKRYRGALMPLRALPAIRSLAEEGWPTLWTTAIVDSNPVAEGVFVHRARPSFPRFELVSEFRTLGLHTPSVPRGRRSSRVDNGVSIGTAETEKSKSITKFLRSYGQGKEFYPCYVESDFLEGKRFPGLGKQDILVARKDDGIVGVCAVWDQSCFKRIVVHGYTGSLSVLRPLINLVGPITGMKRLPTPGNVIPSATLTAVAVKNDDTAVWNLLLDAAVDRARVMGQDYLLAGFSVRSSLLREAGRRRHILYKSRMYAFGFHGLKPNAFNRKAEPYMEIAAL
jgi:hypothetical protein